jgi:hypothetical protein
LPAVAGELAVRLHDRDSAVVSADGHSGPMWERLESQIKWYDANARSNQVWFKGLKVAQIAFAAAIPVTAAAGASATVAGAMGALIVILEALQQLFQFQPNWTTYRSTCEALKREKFLFLAHAGDYADRANGEQLLAMRVETLVSDETSKWAAAQQEQIVQDGDRAGHSRVG